MKRLMVIILFLLITSSSSKALGSSYTFQKDYQSLIKKKYILIPHKGTYLLPLSYNDNPNTKVYEQAFPAEIKKNKGHFNDYTEAEFQISFLILTNKNIFDSNFDTFIGYTHQSWWQVYNADWSRPFRETNYAPEVFFRRILDQSVSVMSGKFLAYDFGFIHQSNGQIQELSRSWNRFFYRFMYIIDRLLIKTTLWYRVPEKNEDDENSREYNFLGYGEVELNYKYQAQKYQLRIIPGLKKQGFELSVSSPWKEGLRFYTKIGHGFILADPFSNSNN